MGLYQIARFAGGPLRAGGGIVRRIPSVAQRWRPAKPPSAVDPPVDLARHSWSRPAQQRSHVRQPNPPELGELGDFEAHVVDAHREEGCLVA